LFTIIRAMPAALLLPALALAALVTAFLSGILGMAGGMILMGALLALLPVADAMVLHGMSDADFRNWTRRVVLAIASFYLASGLWSVATR
jgi:hypothetical protein